MMQGYLSKVKLANTSFRFKLARCVKWKRESVNTNKINSENVSEKLILKKI